MSINPVLKLQPQNTGNYRKHIGFYKIKPVLAMFYRNKGICCQKQHRFCKHLCCFINLGSLGQRKSLTCSQKRSFNHKSSPSTSSMPNKFIMEAHNELSLSVELPCFLKSVTNLSNFLTKEAKLFCTLTHLLIPNGDKCNTTVTCHKCITLTNHCKNVI